MNKFKSIGLSLFAVGFFAFNPNTANAVSLNSGDFFQLTVAPGAIGAIQVSFDPDNNVPQDTVLAADENVFLSNLVANIGATFDFTVENTTQGVVIGILDTNSEVGLNFNNTIIDDATLQVSSEVNINAQGGILLELKNSQGDVIDTIEEGSGSITYDKLTFHNQMPFLIESSVCGNGKVEPVEECDDGNDDENDFCTNTCTIIIPDCGDDVVQGNEECDDGNDINGDGCSNACTIEDFCGNGVIDGTEECDDANNDNDDDCSNICLINDNGGCSLINQSGSSTNALAFVGLGSVLAGALFMRRRSTSR